MSVHVQVGPFRVAQRGPRRSDPITAPTKRQVNRVKMALAAIEDDIDLGAIMPLGNEVLFGWVGLIPGTKSRAAGYAVSRTRTLIRDGLSDARDLSLDSAIYTILHEGPLGHISLAQVPPDDDWQLKALALLDTGVALPPFTDPDEVWVQAPGDEAKAKALKIDKYWLRPYEAIIDANVQGCADGTDASWSKKYRRGVSDLEALKQLWVGPRRTVIIPLPPELPTPPTEPPLVTPLPPEPDPCEEV